MHIAITPAGSFGSSLTIPFSRKGHHTKLWVREPSQRYRSGLPWHAEIPRPKHSTVVATLPDALKGASLVVLSPAAPAAREVLELLATHLAPGIPVLSVIKGLEPETGKTMSMLASELLPKNPFAILAGAMLADDVATGKPVEGVVSCNDGALAEVLAHSLSVDGFDLHASTDVLGVELAAVWKNAIGLMAGFAAGRSETLDTDTLWKEARELAEDLGSNGMSFSFLDADFALALTPESRNYRLGLALAQGKELKAVTTEGVSAIRGLSQHPLPPVLDRWVKRLLPLLP